MMRMFSPHRILLTVLCAALACTAAEAAVRNPYGVAVIIGNRDYAHADQVKYAKRDAEAFRKYVTEFLGFNPKRIIWLPDAERKQMRDVFGSERYFKGLLWRKLDKRNRSDVVVFYSGHGAPGLIDRRGYLVPTDAKPEAMELSGYSTDVLYANLGKMMKRARSVVVYLDACFSGASHAGMLIKNVSAMRVDAPLPEDIDRGVTILTAASGKQVASWDDKARHGLFTNHLLNGLWGGADSNGDGRITAGEVKAYLDVHMTDAAEDINKEQDASLTGSKEAELSVARFPGRPSLKDVAKVGKKAEEVAIGGRPVTGAVSPDALHKAVQGGDVAGLEAALASGADANARDKRGWTALMYAAEKGYVLMVGPLLQAKASPNVRAVDGATALYMAAGQGHPEIIELLMKAGADPGIRGPRGETPAEVARRKYGTVEAAREKGASPPVLALLEGKTWAQVERERLAREARERAEAERKAREKAERERREREAREKAEAERRAREAAERERLAREEAERKVREKAERERLAREKAERERVAKEARERAEAERKAREAAERERAAREARERAEAEELNRRWPAGKLFRDCPECPEMVVMPAGSFMMGSLPDEEDRDEDEGPRHMVTFAKPFAVGKYEVTFAEWDACVAVGGCKGYRPGDRGWGRGRRPVINVSWDDVKAYVEWLSYRTKKSYRLLSEAEWEYAARAGMQTRYSWGDDIDSNRANCGSCGSRWDNKQTAPVGSFSANSFDVHDLHGNVWEWVEDCGNGNYEGAPSDGSAWADGDCGWARVARGGSWYDILGNLRSATRSRIATWSRGNHLGFRVARTLEP